MYPLTHLYVTARVLGELTPALALGSILPDLLVGTGIPWSKAHQPLDLDITNRLENQEIALGAIIHGIDLPGLDYFSDLSYKDEKGYAYQLAACLETEILQLGVHQDHVLWRGHNFIEMGVEVLLNEHHPHLWLFLEKARILTHLQDEVQLLVLELRAKRPEFIDNILDRFLKMRGQKNVLAKDYSLKLAAFYQISLSEKQSLSVLDKSLSLVNDSYSDFLEHCIERIAHSLNCACLI
ncbi:MAG TPA: hypothetical protein GX711_06880 [Clostridia bacterium]|nr:hypothetical protein [Clostridia bacterium]